MNWWILCMEKSVKNVILSLKKIKVNISIISRMNIIVQIVETNLKLTKKKEKYIKLETIQFGLTPKMKVI